MEFDTTAPSAKDNIEAIELLFTLENEGRAATAEEKKILAKYKGWGGIDNVEFAFEGKKFTARAMRAGNDIYISYDNPRYTPQQLAMHEYLHTAYNTPEVESAKKKVLDSMSGKEYI